MLPLKEMLTELIKCWWFKNPIRLDHFLCCFKYLLLHLGKMNIAKSNKDIFVKNTAKI